MFTRDVYQKKAFIQIIRETSGLRPERGAGGAREATLYEVAKQIFVLRVAFAFPVVRIHHHSSMAVAANLESWCLGNGKPVAAPFYEQVEHSGVRARKVFGAKTTR